MVTKLQIAWKELENNLDNLQKLSEEGRKISSNMMFNTLSKQISNSFAVIAENTVHTKLFLASRLLQMDQKSTASLCEVG